MPIQLEHVNYLYDEDTTIPIRALNDINLEIPDGQFVGVIGHTGSGKSTLVQHMNGLMKATSGAVYFNGRNIYDKDYNLKELRSKVGLVFQYPEHQLFETDVFSDVCFGPKNLGLDKEEVERRAYDALRKVGLPEEYYFQSPFEMSGGQKRRVAIAGVMAMKPEVLVLDEPAAGLDPAGRNDIFELIRSYNENTGCTVIIVSHSMEDMAKYAEKIIVMNKAKLYCHDYTEKVFSYADEIAKMGLDVPQITRVFSQLEKDGICFDKKIYTVGYAKKKILEYLGKKGGDRIC